MMKLPNLPIVRIKGEFRVQDGFLVGKYLVISYSPEESINTRGSYVSDLEEWMIYKRSGGLALEHIRFARLDDAIRFAKLLDKEYDGYLSIWDADKTLNPFALVKWTIPNGLELWSAIEVLEDARVTLKSYSEINDYKDRIQERMKYWTRGINWAAPR